MSSKVTGDAQPDANIPTETDQTLPTEIVEKLAGAGAVAVAENTDDTEPAAESRSTPETATESALGEPTKVTEGTQAADGTKPPEPPAAGTQAATAAETPAETEAEAVPEGTENLAELGDPAEPAELIAMTEPVELAELAELVELVELVEVAEPRRRGHGVLIACVFVVAALAIVGGAIAIVGSLTHGFKKPVVIHYKKSAVFSLKTGECIDPNGQAATIVSCNTPHDAEVFATFSLPGSTWPGTAAVSAAASSGCSTRLTGYLNPQLAISLASTYVYPDPVAWRAGTRTVICEVRATSGQLTGSVRGASATAS